MQEASINAMDPQSLEDVARNAKDRLSLWTEFIGAVGARRVAEIGVYRGLFAERVLDQSPDIETYYMIDPWRHLDDWNKPANKADDQFDRIHDEAMTRTQAHEARRTVLRGRTTEMIDEIPEASLDFAYVDGDHTLRGITLDLLNVYPRVKDGGWLGGDDFCRTIWQHGKAFEPTLVFPFAVHFAEAVGARIYALPFKQFLIEKRTGSAFEFVDWTGRYDRTDLLSHMGAAETPAAAADTGSVVRAGRSLLTKARALGGRARR